MEGPKPIETRYAGCRFRSRLEARWAVFFDALRVPWEYEPEGFALPDGTAYLPDFWLPEQEIWLEVRAERSERLDTVKRFAELLPRGQRCILAFGDIPRPSRITRGGLRADRPKVQEPLARSPHHPGYMLWLGPTFWDDGTVRAIETAVAFCRCPCCGQFEIDVAGPAVCIECACEREELFRDIDFSHVEAQLAAGLVLPYLTAREARLLEAFQRARSARFERGETPDRFGPSEM